MVHVPARLSSSMGSEPALARRRVSICFASTEINLGAGGVFDFASVEGCLFDHHTSPPRMMSMASEVKSLPDFMAVSLYLRFHQTETPERITISGRKITLVRNMTLMAEPVTRSRR